MEFVFQCYEIWRGYLAEENFRLSLKINPTMLKCVCAGGGGGSGALLLIFKSNRDFIGFDNKSVNFCISPIPEFSKPAS